MAEMIECRSCKGSGLDSSSPDGGCEVCFGAGQVPKR